MSSCVTKKHARWRDSLQGTFYSPVSVSIRICCSGLTLIYFCEDIFPVSSAQYKTILNYVTSSKIFFYGSLAGLQLSGHPHQHSPILFLCRFPRSATSHCRNLRTKSTGPG